MQPVRGIIHLAPRRRPVIAARPAGPAVLAVSIATPLRLFNYCRESVGPRHCSAPTLQQLDYLRSAGLGSDRLSFHWSSEDGTACPGCRGWHADRTRDGVAGAKTIPSRQHACVLHSATSSTLLTPAVIAERRGAVPAARSALPVSVKHVTE